MRRYLPVRHIRGDGKIFWQPRYNDQRLFDQITYLTFGTITERVWAYKGDHLDLTPVLYRSEKRATRVAIRQHKKVMKGTFYIHQKDRL